jgi:ABC-2 type transport system ATP-binding protein
MTTSIALLEGASKHYGATQALLPTTLSMSSGVVGLLGPNGAGKTTLLKILASAMPPSAGRIAVAGHDVTGSIAERTEARRHIGYLPQEVEFPRGMTAFGFVDYIAVLKEWSTRASRHGEVRRVLELMGLGDLGTRKVRTLSGGQRRRLGLAQALIGQPDLLVLDEPTTGLDPGQRASLRALLSSHATAGCVLLSTHQTEDVAALCDRVVVLSTGTVLFDGAVDELIEAARGQVWVGPEAAESAVAFWRTGGGSVRSVGGVPPVGADPVEPTVEDAYLFLLGGQPASAEGSAA